MKNRNVSIFIGFGSLAIVAGGILSAIAAGSPSYVLSWVVAYLVLVVGVVQILLGLGVYRLARVKVSTRDMIIAFTLFNAGSAAVIAGTVIKYTLGTTNYLVGIGGLLVSVAMIVFLRMVRGADKTKWLLGYYFLVDIVLISMVIGVVLSAGAV